MFMAIDQQGHAYPYLKHPRKELLEQLGRKHAEKMYLDGEDGKPIHVGYVIAGRWLRVYSMAPFKPLVPDEKHEPDSAEHDPRKLLQEIADVAGLDAWGFPSANNLANATDLARRVGKVLQ